MGIVDEGKEIGGSVGISHNQQTRLILSLYLLISIQVDCSFYKYCRINECPTRYPISIIDNRKCRRA
jgi:hypothetical protein